MDSDAAQEAIKLAIQAGKEQQKATCLAIDLSAKLNTLR